MGMGMGGGGGGGGGGRIVNYKSIAKEQMKGWING